MKAGVKICSVSSALRCLSRVMADSSSPPELLLEKVTTHTWTRSLHHAAMSAFSYSVQHVHVCCV